MKKTIALPKKKTMTKHKFAPVKVNAFPTDTDPTSTLSLTTTHF
ncbi:hypothetical protein [Mucilaginibacter achroorhodeus]|nr:hypothetical protein [Mucilaginibacter achroorhodeus]